MIKKLLIIIKNIDGGTGTFLNQLSKLPQEFGESLEISVLALQREENTDLSEFKSISYFSNKKIRDYYSLTLSEVKNLIKEVLWLKKEINLLSPDLIISIDTHSNLLASFVKKLFYKNVKLIATTHNNLDAVAQKKLSISARIALKIVFFILLSSIDRLVCNSQGTAVSLKKYLRGPKEIKIIPYGLDIKKVSLLSRSSIEFSDRYLFSGSERVILSIGRLEEQKDFETLIKAVKISVKTIQNFRLIIIGDGTKRKKLEKLIEKLKLKGIVFMPGWRKNIYPYLKRSDLFILSSRYEGFGYVILEAMSQGVPVISTDSPFGPAEILKNGQYGMMVPKQHPGHLSFAINRVLADNVLRKDLTRKSKIRIKDYSEKEMLFAYSKIIKEL